MTITLQWLALHVSIKNEYMTIPSVILATNLKYLCSQWCKEIQSMAIILICKHWHRTGLLQIAHLWPYRAKHGYWSSRYSSYVLHSPLNDLKICGLFGACASGSQFPIHSSTYLQGWLSENVKLVMTNIISQWFICERSQLARRQQVQHPLTLN